MLIVQYAVLDWDKTKEWNSEFAYNEEKTKRKSRLIGKDIVYLDIKLNIFKKYMKDREIVKLVNKEVDTLCKLLDVDCARDCEL